MRIKRTLGVIAAATLIMVTGCGNAVDENVEKENTPAQESSVPVELTESASDEQLEEPAAEADSDYRVVSGGPYGQISLFVPDGWEYIVCPVDDDQMSYGLYGFILKPLEASEGQIKLFCSDSFGVCGTGLKQEEMTLAGETAHVGTYDEHEHWDFITFGSDSPQIVAQSIGCDGWTDGMWDEAMTILDSMSFDITKTEGGIGQYISDSEVEALGLVMDVRNVSPTGLTVHFRQYEKKDVGEMFYGEPCTLERLVDEKWEAVPRIVAEASYHDIAYIIPPEGESEFETNWEWLYGRLDPGTYKITKIVMTQKEGSDSNPNYSLSAQFLIADSDVVRTYEVTDGNRAEELIANNQLLTMVRYYEMADGTWKTDECAYKYRLEITGRMGGAVKDSTFVYLSNIEDISFDLAWKAAGLSSSMDDYFDMKDAVLVAMK